MYFGITVHVERRVAKMSILKQLFKKVDDYFFGDLDYYVKDKLFFYSFMIGMPTFVAFVYLLMWFI